MNRPIDFALYRQVKEMFDAGRPLEPYMRQWLMRHVFYFMPPGPASYTDASLMERMDKRIAEEVTKRLLAGTPDR